MSISTLLNLRYDVVTSPMQVLKFRAMYIMADLSAPGEPAHSHDVVLVAIKAYPDGSFDMRPGFSKPGKKYRFEDERGMLSKQLRNGACTSQFSVLPCCLWYVCFSEFRVFHRYHVIRAAVTPHY